MLLNVKFNNKRIIYIDYVKLLCISLIIFQHAVGWANKYFGYTFLTMNSIYCVTFSNPLFFIISGYFCKKQNRIEFLKKRFYSLILPCWFFSSIKLFVSFLSGGAYFHTTTIASELYDAFINGNYYWFPYALFVMDFIISLTWNNEQKNYKNGIIKSICVIVVFLCANILIKDFGFGKYIPALPFQIMSAIQFFPFFLLGYFLKSNQINLFNRSSLMFFISLLLCLLLNSIHLLIVKNVPYFFDVVFYLSASYCCCFFFYKMSSKITILEKFGLCSLQLYFFDPFIRVLLFSLISFLFPVNLFLIVIITILEVIIGRLICSLSCKINCIKVLIGLKYFG